MNMQSDMITRHATQLLDPATLAWWVRSLRQASGWSQETLAELSGLTVRTIQRVEAGRPSGLDTRRALARGLGYDDLDVFDKAEGASKIVDLRAELGRIVEHASPHLTLTAKRAESGWDLGRLAEAMDAYVLDYPDDLPMEAKQTFATLSDYMIEYGDVHELYSESERIVAYDDIDRLLTELDAHTVSVCYALRHKELIGDQWVNKTPVSITIGYVCAFKKGHEPKHFAVPKDRM